MTTTQNTEGTTMTTTTNKITVHCCDDCGCEVEIDTGYCAACNAYPAVTSALVDADERRPVSHVVTGTTTTTAQKVAHLFGDDGLTFKSDKAIPGQTLTLSETCQMYGATMREIDGGFIADFRDGSHLSATGGGWDLCDEDGNWDGAC